MSDDMPKVMDTAEMVPLYTTVLGMELQIPPYGNATNTQPCMVPPSVAEGILHAKKHRGGKDIVLEDTRLSLEQTIFPEPESPAGAEGEGDAAGDESAAAAEASTTRAAARPTPRRRGEKKE
jgi:hypothetical protein